ncbi:MAG TPA: amidohydrolase family protein [Candidatus Caccalectryoclostridium excrementigallinarum]|uniref:Amidohydrolase family protein n=1 Tax=Candidatus Caccalectryoclostridium excrementigallinarum TaxID=2840710 RepID=A0A9D1MN22_9FIRM|nr:amidohydrolase family protein [Candidatus Caccalectryoclostridium excrementigallinarum]
MKTTLANVRPFSSGAFGPLCNIVIEDGKILSLGNVMAGEITDGKGMIACAGFIDIHTHGGWGKDCMEPTFEAIDTVAKYHLSTGITSFCPTTMTADIADIEAALSNMRSYKTNGARLAGAHLEGPFLSAKAAGAHPLDKLRDPDRENTAFIARNRDVVRRITVAPDLSGAPFVTALCRSMGIQVSIGHDQSIDDEIYACIEAGATSVTHMGNCTSHASRRYPSPKKHLGLFETALGESRLVCEVIADDRHVPDALFDIFYRLKGKDGICFVSDSLSVAGMKEGDYFLGSGESAQPIRIEDGVAVLPDKHTYAGSVTPVSKMVSRLFAKGYPAEDLLTMATLTPAKTVGLNDRGDLRPGMLADINLLDDKLNVVKTFMF